MNISLLRQLIEIPSCYPNEGELSRFIRGWAQKNVDCTSHAVPAEENRSNIVFVKGKAKRSILLVGHLDTISPTHGWHHNPYRAVVKKGYMYGLGSWDMKAGLYILLHVLQSYNPRNFTLKVAFTVDEENYSIGAHTLIDSGICSDALCCLVPEPGFESGESGIVIGRSGRATYEVVINGISAHGSAMHRGVNAITQAAAFINNMILNKLANTQLFPRSIQSNANGFSVPDICTIQLDCLLQYPETPASILDSLKEIAESLYREKIILCQPTVRYTDRPTPFCAPYRLSRTNGYVKLAATAIQETGHHPTFHFRTSVSDECIYANRLQIPAICIGPSGVNAHHADEGVHLTSVRNCIQVYMRLLQLIDKTYET